MVKVDQVHQLVLVVNLENEEYARDVELVVSLALSDANQLGIVPWAAGVEPLGNAADAVSFLMLLVPRVRHRDADAR